MDKINNAKYSMHYATTDLKFGSCTTLSSSSPVTEASKFVSVEIESPSQISSHRCGLYYVDDLLPHAPLELYAGTGDVVKFFIIQQIMSELLVNKTSRQ